jgi:hypothetical protein
VVAGAVTSVGTETGAVAGVSGMPSPLVSFGAFGLASLTCRLNSYGRPLLPPRASMTDSSGLVIQPEPSRLRM